MIGRLGRWGRRLRGARRARQVLAVLTRHGLADLASELRPAAGRPDTSRRPGLPSPRRLRLAMEELGPVFVKLGQGLSTRHDLLDEAWTAELSKLQENVPPVPFAEIDAALDEAFGPRLAELFSDIDQVPLAAGSIAQIHRGRLVDGSEIVLKVLRPRIRARVEADLEVMGLLAGFLERRAPELGFSPLELVREFARSIRNETDMLHEGQSTDQFRKQFADDPRVAFPRVYWEATTPRVLTLEMFEGPTLSRIKPEELDAGVRQSLLEAGTDAVFRQCLEHGFFHADPHPGNLMILPDGRLGFVDCGMTGRIDEPTAQSLADLVSGVVAQDGDRVVEAAVSLAEADTAMLSDRRLRRTLEDLMLRLDAGSLERLNLGDLLRRFFDALREHRIQCPSDLLMLIKALTTIEGVAAWLDPSFDVVAHSRPHIERLIQRRYSPGALFQSLSRALHAYSGLLAGLPRDLQLLIERLRHNDLRLRIDHVGLRRLTVTLEYSSRVVAFALVIAAVIVGSAILALADRTSGEPGVLSKLAIGGAGTAGVLALLMALTHRRPRD